MRYIKIHDIKLHVVAVKITDSIIVQIHMTVHRFATIEFGSLTPPFLKNSV